MSKISEDAKWTLVTSFHSVRLSLHPGNKRGLCSAPHPSRTLTTTTYKLHVLLYDTVPSIAQPFVWIVASDTNLWPLGFYCLPVSLNRKLTQFLFSLVSKYVVSPLESHIKTKGLKKGCNLWRRKAKSLQAF